MRFVGTCATAMVRLGGGDVGRHEGGEPARADPVGHDPAGPGLKVGLLVGLGHQHVRRHHDVGLLEHRRQPEGVAAAAWSGFIRGL